jgi:hypothetical protein
MEPRSTMMTFPVAGYTGGSSRDLLTQVAELVSCCGCSPAYAPPVSRSAFRFQIYSDAASYLLALRNPFLVFDGFQLGSDVR